MRESTFSFWQDAEFNALIDKPLTVEDDAYHPPREGETLEESWLFEILTPDHLYFRVAFTLSNMSSSPPAYHKLAWWVGGEKNTESIEVGPQDFTASTERCQLKIGPSRAEYTGNKYSLYLESTRVTGELEFFPLLAGWQPGIGRVAYGDQGLRYIYWQVPVPRASVQGEVSLEGKRYKIEGIGYHDHRRCNFPLPEALEGARIIRFYTDEYTLLAADFWGNLLYSRRHIQALYLAKGSEMKLSTSKVESNLVDTQGSSSLELRTGTDPMVTFKLNTTHLLGEKGSFRVERGSGFLRLATTPEEESQGWGVLETFIIG
ncbi:hypothetical protein SAMN00808754_2014 [Thermanaeromonas toyohensis ToBE]|uniref:Hydroxyneurosporene synthase (CrtC) n=1 Tax=Thermanaeromonas toyohensis ToBE TaxID=698762 RepID=A0A1W1VWZ5_9FIRM|nr:hypothetical protein [Thermanaeromonas toyohensis]SMB97892.1 hypothetical protein SAMN00808754_2014 [Thermanaeromonas toyohensis ToBE]